MSEDVYKVSHVYESMTQKTSSTSQGYGIGLSSNTIGLLLGTSSSEGETQSLLAKKLSPPENPIVGSCGCAVVAFIILIIVSILVGANSSGIIGWGILIVGCILIGAIAANTRSSKNPKYDETMRIWNSKWICNRCGNIFVINSQ